MKDDGESSSVWLKFCLNLWKINIWWGYRSSELSLLSPPYVKEPPLPPSQAPVWKMKERPALSGHRRCGGFSNPAWHCIHILGPANPGIFYLGTFQFYILETYLKVTLANGATFSITPPENNIENPTQLFILTIFAQHLAPITCCGRLFSSFPFCGNIQDN